jgi:Tfp pilus assembly protein PilF
MQIKKKFLYSGIVLIIILITAAAFSIRPAYKYVKSLRAKDHLSVAEDYLTKGLAKEAWQKAEVAKKLDPKNKDIQRFMAKIMTSKDPQESIQVWEDLLSLEYDSTEDRLDYIQVLLGIGNIGKAEMQLRIAVENSLTEIETNPKWLFVQSILDEKSGRTNESIKRLNQIIEINDGMLKEALLSKVRLSISSKNSEVFEEGRKLLNKLSIQEDLLGLQALRFYFRITGFSAEQAEDILQKTLVHPLSNRLDKMKAFAILHQASPDRSSYCVDKLREFFDLENDDDIYQYAMWLGSLRLWDQVLEILTFQRSASVKKLFLLRMDAMANLQKWGNIENEFSNRSVQIENHWKRVFRGRAFSVMGDKKRARIQWEQAHGATQGDPKKIVECCLYLEKIREYEGLGFLLRKLADYAQYEVLAIEKILSYEAAKLELKEMLSLVDRLAKRKQDNLPLKNDLAYFNLLNEKKIAESTNTAKQNFQKSPGTLGFRVTYALGLYQQTEYLKAMNLLNESFINWSDARPAWKMIYAKILEKNDYTSKASEIISKVKLSSISRSESSGLESM